VLGKNIEVFLKIGPRKLDLTGDLPFMFRPFQKKIVGVIGREVEAWVVKAQNGEL
jgi:hypothetical protein